MLTNQLTVLLFFTIPLMAPNALGVNKCTLKRIAETGYDASFQPMQTSAARPTREITSSNTPPSEVRAHIPPGGVKVKSIYDEENELACDEQNEYSPEEEADYNETLRKESSRYNPQTKFIARTTRATEKNTTLHQEKKRRERARPFSEAEKVFMRRQQKAGASWQAIARAMENRRDDAVRAFLQNDGHILQRKPISPQEFQQILEMVVAGANFVEIGRKFNRNIASLRKKIKKLGPEEHARIYALREQSLKKLYDQAAAF